MQDRYLFRGKREDNGNWIIGLPYTSKPDVGTVDAILEIGNYMENDFGMQARHFEKVDPETIGQCAGLKDKNGKLIFEGDVLRGSIEYRKKYGDPEVEYGCYADIEIDALKYNSCPETNEDHDVIENLDSANYGWYFDSKDYGEGGIDPKYINTFEIIGNIHDKEQSN